MPCGPRRRSKGHRPELVPGCYYSSPIEGRWPAEFRGLSLSRKKAWSATGQTSNVPVPHSSLTSSALVFVVLAFDDSWPRAAVPVRESVGTEAELLPFYPVKPMPHRRD